MSGSKKRMALAAAGFTAVTAGLQVMSGTSASASESRATRPASYVISHDAGVVPEGVAVSRDGTMYVSSQRTGAIYVGEIKAPALRRFAADGVADRGSSLGVHTDDRGRLWSVGGDTLLVHDRSGDLVWKRISPQGPLGTPHLNDLVLTRQAVYVTDWANARILRAERMPQGLGDLEPWLDIRPAWPGFPAQYWLLNGIVANRSGSTLLVSSNGTEAIWRVHTASKEVTPVDLGSQSFGADGLVLDGTRLYAVLNYGAPAGVYVAELDPTLSTGRVAHRILEDVNGEAFKLPTTLAVHQCRIYVVNSQADAWPGTPPYTVSTTPDPTC